MGREQGKTFELVDDRKHIAEHAHEHPVSTQTLIDTLRWAEEQEAKWRRDGGR